MTALLFMLLLSFGSGDFQVLIPPEGLTLGKPFLLVPSPGKTPEGLLDLGPDFKVLGFSLKKGGYEVMALRSGTLDLPAFDQGDRHFSGAKVRVDPPPLPKGSGPVIPDLLQVPRAPFRAWPFVCLGVLLIATTGYLVSRRRSAKPLPKRRGSELLLALSELEKDASPPREWYGRLSRIVRLFLCARFKVKTLERTPEEIARSFKGAGFLPKTEEDRLNELLHEADLVKFAGRERSKNEKALDLAFVRTFLESFDPAGES